MANQRNSKVVRFRKPFGINIGLLIFLAVFLYFLYYAYSFFTGKPVAVYEVTQGTMAQSTMFKGLALREETVVYAQDDGYLTLYNKNDARVGYGNPIASIDETGDFHRLVHSANDGQLGLSEESYVDLACITDGFLASFSDASFYQIYQYESDMGATLVEAISRGSLQQMDELPTRGSSLSGLHLYRADQDGVVVHHVDGLEDVGLDELAADMFLPASYQKEKLDIRERIAAGDPIYKMITNEYWNVVFPIDQGLADHLDGRGDESIQVEFKKDRSTAWGRVHVINREEGPYLSLGFSNSMVRFASDRFVELELLGLEHSGLKIPNTAILNKDFFTVPKDYVSTGENTSREGLLKEVVDSSGEAELAFVPVSVFRIDGELWAVESGELSIGDSVRKKDSDESHVLIETVSLEGVFNVNRGYAMFRPIEILFHNEEHAIIKEGTPNGVTNYDHIALMGNSIKGGDIVRLR